VRVLLLYPPYERLKGFKTDYFPGNLGQLAACLRQGGHYVRAYNAETGPKNDKAVRKYSEWNRAVSHKAFIDAFNDDLHPVWREIYKTINEFNPDLIGISSMTITFPVTLKIASIAKQVNKDIAVVIGGCHSTVLPEDVIKRKDVDYVIQGEGEIPLVKLCNCLEAQDANALYDIRGLFYKKNGHIVKNRPNEFIDDIDSLPFIQKELILHPERYRPSSYDMIMASRGCPHECTFCSSPAIWKRKVRYRKPEKLIEEMNYLWKEFKVRQFRFFDDTFTSNRNKVLEFCGLLNTNKIKFTWSCFVRANTVDKELLERLKKAGCRSISMGIESGSDRVLRLIKKGITVDTVKKSAALIKKKGFLLGSFWMIGIPHETETDMMETIALMNELDLDHVNLCTFTPEPMTELCDICVKKGLLEENIDWGRRLDFSHHSADSHFNKNVSRDRYREILKKALETAEYKNKRTFARKIKSFWTQRNYFLRWDVIWQRINS